MSERIRKIACVSFCGLTLLLPAPVLAACDWPAAKRDIEDVLDRDKAKGDEFRKVTKAGRDSLDAIEKIVDEAARARIRECSYEAGELLTQRGFPPLH